MIEGKYLKEDILFLEQTKLPTFSGQYFKEVRLLFEQSYIPPTSFGEPFNETRELL